VKVAFVVEDAGGARAVLPVVREVASATLLLGPAAADVARSMGMQVEPERVVTTVEDVERQLTDVANADVVVTGSTCWGLRMEARAVRAAREARRASLTVVDFWSNYRERLSFPGEDDWNALPTCLAVVDDKMRSDLLKLHPPEVRLEVTGSPAFDELFDRQALPRGDVVTFLSQPIQALYGDGLGYTERSILVTLAGACRELGYPLQVKPHPREDAKALATLAESLGVTMAEGTLSACFARSFAVVGMTTMGLVEAALVGRRAFSVQLGRVGEDALPTNAGGLTTAVASAADLREGLRAARADVSNDPSLRLTDLGWRPGAARRVASLIASVAS
jgi:hypothetical protein